MGLIHRLAEEFDANRRNRGLNYFERGAVDILRITHRSLTASVQAEKRHTVEIDWDGGLFEWSCTCEESANEGIACKHIWATLLAADQAKRLPDEGQLDELSGSPSLPDELPVFDASTGQIVQAAVRTATSKSARPAVWKRRILELQNSMNYRQSPGRETWPANRQLLYILDTEMSVEVGAALIELGYRMIKRDGQFEKPRLLKQLSRSQIGGLPEQADRQILQMLTGASDARYRFGYGDWNGDAVSTTYRLPAATLETTIKTMCESGRCILRERRNSTMQPLAWDAGGAWQFMIEVRRDSSGFARVDGFFQRGSVRLPILDPELVLGGGIVIHDGKAAPLDDSDAFELIIMLRRDEKLAAPAGQEQALIKELFSLPRLPKVNLSQDLGMEQIDIAPTMMLRVSAPNRKYAFASETLRAELSFDYGGQIVSAHQGAAAAIFLQNPDRLIHRDVRAEDNAWAQLLGLGFKEDFDYERRQPGLNVKTKAFPLAVRQLAGQGWRIEADGKLYRNPGALKIDVSSGIDWFEVHGVADFDGQQVSLPKLLATLRKGENTITLGDGTIGIVPEEWLQKYGLLANLGQEEADHLQFKRSQAGLLDALLAAKPEISFDVSFSEARNAMRTFEGVQAIDAPPTFVGQLRPYQQEGLGWLAFLRRFSFGGCLADDMGLGKTVQILALLDDRRIKRITPNGHDLSNPDSHPAGPSLVIVPKSLVFNWQQEALRFAPQLKLLDHTGALRAKTAEHFSKYDVIVTTYGTLRNDAAFLKDVVFDYVVLDEAQAIKNAASESAKAARLLSAQHRLALSGTPVQNHLGELWSLFEFLNPGMLGASNALAGAGSGRAIDEENRVLLSRALRPFILRRTKGQVAKELPARLEQTIYCDLDAAQRKAYDELRDHYRQALLNKIATDGINKSKIMILEALLRLRQAACHPGLIDKTRTDEGSAKLDMLLSRLAEVSEEGHKALVFSQFTSLLSIVRKRLDAQKIPYEYLDGKTKDRDARVNRFQTDPNCMLFLVSLKAGGVGLNLTAAEYVFLLDPWWNPAVEAQAIDRAHRIGQTRQVFAYRLITRDTVEQKVLDLQQTKRDLADAVINADNRTIATLSREDLELLLS